jgi:O-antigen/teichoic acid export membrane protein
MWQEQNTNLMNQAWTKFLPEFLRVRVEGRAYFQNVVNNIGWQFADNIIRMGVGLVVGVWLARYLGPEQFGTLSYAFALVGLFSAFATLGLDDIAARDIVRDPESRDENLGTVFFLMLAGGVISFLAAIGAILILRPSDSLSHWLVGIIGAGVIFQSLNVIEIWFHSQVQAKYIVIPKNAAFLSCSLLKIFLILSGQPLIAFAWIATFEVAVGSAGLIVAYTSQKKRIMEWRFRLKRAGNLLNDSWPLLFSSIIIMIYMRIDQVMLGEMVGTEELGIYSVAVRLTEVWIFIPLVIFNSVYPAVVEAREKDEALLYDRLQKLYNLMALTAYAVAIPMTLLAGWLVNTLYEEAYSKAGPMLALLIWSNVFINLGMARGAFLNSMNWTRIHFISSLLGCLLNILLNFLLIPRYGGMGAVAASLIAYWFAAHFTCFLFPPLFRTGIMLTKALLYPKIW